MALYGSGLLPGLEKQDPRRQNQQQLSAKLEHSTTKEPWHKFNNASFTILDIKCHKTCKADGHVKGAGVKSQDRPRVTRIGLLWFG